MGEIAPLDVFDDPASIMLDGGGTDTEDVPDLPVSEQSPLQALAFTIWALEAGRDIRKTQDIIKARTGMLVSVVQIREWRRVGKWGENVGSVNHALGNLVFDTRRTISFGTIKAASFLVQLVQDESATNNERFKAAATLLDRGGFPVMMRGELFSGLHMDDYDEVNDAELEAEWNNYSALPGDVVTPDPIEARHGDTGRIGVIADQQLRTDIAQGRAGRTSLM